MNNVRRILFWAYSNPFYVIFVSCWMRIFTQTLKITHTFSGITRHSIRSCFQLCMNDDDSECKIFVRTLYPFDILRIGRPSAFASADFALDFLTFSPLKEAVRKSMASLALSQRLSFSFETDSLMSHRTDS